MQIAENTAEKRQLSGYEEFRKLRQTASHLHSYQNMHIVQQPDKAKFHV
jgi:hypothetical protein